MQKCMQVMRGNNLIIDYGWFSGHLSSEICASLHRKLGFQSFHDLLSRLHEGVRRRGEAEALHLDRSHLNAVHATTDSLRIDHI
jgi:hypothetical protein